MLTAAFGNFFIDFKIGFSLSVPCKMTFYTWPPCYFHCLCTGIYQDSLVRLLMLLNFIASSFFLAKLFRSKLQILPFAGMKSERHFLSHFS